MPIMTFTKTVLKNLFSDPATTKYPAVPKEYPERARGHIVNDIDQCILCGMCMRSCPPGAITVVRNDAKWIINRFDCVQCGYCVEKCPKKCLHLVPGYQTPGPKKLPEVMVRPGGVPTPAKPAARPAGANAAAAKAAGAAGAKPAAAAGTADGAAKPKPKFTPEEIAAMRAANLAKKAAADAAKAQGADAAQTAAPAASAAQTQAAEAAKTQGADAAQTQAAEAAKTQGADTAQTQAAEAAKTQAAASAAGAADGAAKPKPKFTPEEIAAMRAANLAKRAAAKAAETEDKQ